MPGPQTAASRDEDEDSQAILRTLQERRQRRQAVQTPVLLEAEEGGDSSGPGQASPQPLKPRKEAELPPRRRLSREQRSPWAREEESLADQEAEGRKKGVSEKPPTSEKSSVLEKIVAPGKRLVSEETSISEKVPGPEKTSVSVKRVISEKKSVLEKTSVSEKKMLAPGKTSDSERRLVSEKALLFEKSLVSQETPGAETKLAPKTAAASGRPQAGQRLASGGSQPTTTEQRGGAVSEKSPRSLAELGEHGAPGPPTVASRLPPITLQVGSAPAPPIPAHAPLILSPVVSGSLAVSRPSHHGPRFGSFLSPYLLPIAVRIGVIEARAGCWQLERASAVLPGSTAALNPFVTQGLDSGHQQTLGKPHVLPEVLLESSTWCPGPTDLCPRSTQPRQGGRAVFFPSSPAALGMSQATWGPHGSLGFGLPRPPV